MTDRPLGLEDGSVSKVLTLKGPEFKSQNLHENKACGECNLSTVETETGHLMNRACLQICTPNLQRLRQGDSQIPG